MPIRAAITVLPLAILLSTLPLSPARADDAAGAGESGGIALVGRVSTLGAGAEVVLPLGRRVNLRVGGSVFSLNYTDTQEDVDFNVDARLRTGAALLDWHPGAGGFRFSVGGMYNGNEIKGSAAPRTSTEIGDVEYTPAQIGTLNAGVTFPKAAGYAGIGFGNAAAPGSRLTVLLDLGVMFHGEPELKLTANGTLTGNPLFQAELEKERKTIEDDFVKVARFYPVISLGLGFRF